VLLIDPDFEDDALMEAVLGRLPRVRTMVAIQGRLGLALTAHHHPDLVVLALQLPDMAAADVLALLQADHTTRETPVITCGPSLTATQGAALAAAGARAHISKPLDVRRFLVLASDLLATTAPPSRATAMQ